jgi:hypothetical protein
MATIAQTTVTGSVGTNTLTRTTMTASDTLVYNAGTRQMLTMANDTAGSLTVNINGATAVSTVPNGYGKAINNTGGYVVSLSVGDVKQICLDDISMFLQGTVTITGGTGAKATLTV